MAKTLLQLTNRVGKLTRLSLGSTYTAIDQDADAVFIVEAINEAKRAVEAERNWNLLRQTVTFSSVLSTQTYDTSDLAVVTSDPVVTNRRSRLVVDNGGREQFYDITGGDEEELKRVSRDWVTRQRRINDDTTDTRPYFFALYPAGDGLTVEFPYVISEVRDYSFEVINPQPELDDASTEMLIYEDPVVFQAVALVAEERGEELGLNASRWWDRATNALSEAIIIDSQTDADFLFIPV